MKLRILSESDCRAALTMAAAIDIQAEAFTTLARGRSVQGLRSFAISKTPPGVAIFNPCFLQEGGGYGVKVVSDFYGNERRGATRMTGLVALFDGATGYPLAVMEAGYLTDLRTGAATALAARYLARADSRVLALIGAGRVARNQLEALAEAFDIERVLLVTRTVQRAEDFIARMRAAGGRIPQNIVHVASPEEAVGQADLVVAATTSKTPVLSGAWLRPGAFVASVGAHEAASREVDSETIRRASLRVIDSRADCLDCAGDFALPLKEGVLAREDIAELAELVSGQRPGRRHDGEIAYFKSVGAPIQDLVTAQHILREAERRGLGVEVEIGGDSA